MKEMDEKERLLKNSRNRFTTLPDFNWYFEIHPHGNV
jgi:hypothetical protein